MQENEITASLVIYGYKDDVDNLSKELGLKPDKALNKGEPLFPNAAPIPQSLWELTSKLPSNATLEEHVSSILATIQPNKNAIVEVSKRYRAVITVAARYYEQNPEIELDPRTLTEIGTSGLALWLDIYPQSGYYLDSEKKMKLFAKKIRNLDIIKVLSENDHDEAVVLTEAFAVLEDMAVDFEDDLRNYFDERIDHSKDENLEEMAEKLKKIVDVARKSRYLRSKLDL
jgi:hypothetical protein